MGGFRRQMEMEGRVDVGERGVERERKEGVEKGWNWMEEGAHGSWQAHGGGRGRAQEGGEEGRRKNGQKQKRAR